MTAQIYGKAKKRITQIREIWEVGESSTELPDVFGDAGRRRLAFASPNSMFKTDFGMADSNWNPARGEFQRIHF